MKLTEEHLDMLKSVRDEIKQSAFKLELLAERFGDGFDELERESEELRNTASALQDLIYERAMRLPMIAAMFATFEKVPSKAAEFWDPVVTGVNLPGKTDPRYGLHDTMINSKTGGSGRTNKRLISNEDLFRIAVSAWNKWRRGEKIQAAIRPTNERTKPV